MPLKDILRSMVNDYFIICTGIIICQVVIRLIFNPDIGFTLDEIVLILFGGAIFTLPHMAFISYKELSKKQWIYRRIIHFLLLNMLVICFAHLVGWLRGFNVLEHLLIFSSVSVVFILVGFVSWHIDHSNSEAINRRLEEIRDVDEEVS